MKHWLLAGLAGWVVLFTPWAPADEMAPSNNGNDPKLTPAPPSRWPQKTLGPAAPRNKGDDLDGSATGAPGNGAPAPSGTNVQIGYSAVGAVEPPAAPIPEPTPSPPPSVPSNPSAGDAPGIGPPAECPRAPSSFGNRWFTSAEYLLWSVRGGPLPPLATTSTSNTFNFGLGAPVNGALGTPGTSVLIGDSTAGSSVRSGMRGTVGYWFGDDHWLGIEAGGFFLANQSTNFHAESPAGNTLLGRPFSDGVAGVPGLVPSVEAVAGVVQIPGLNPIVVGGSVDVRSTSSFWGTEANLRSNFFAGANYRIDGLVGFRQLALDESLSITENGTFLSPAVVTGSGAVVVPTGSTFAVNDRFAVQNRFYGGQVGLDGEYRLGNWSFGMMGKLALGTSHEGVTISGSTTTNASLMATGSPNTGLLAGPTNIGTFTRERFIVVPEVGLTVGYQVTSYLRLTAGYNAISWSNVVRPGNQIDLAVNRSGGLPGHPAFEFKGTDFWAQGVSCGIALRF